MAPMTTQTATSTESPTGLTPQEAQELFTLEAAVRLHGGDAQDLPFGAGPHVSKRIDFLQAKAHRA